MNVHEILSKIRMWLDWGFLRISLKNFPSEHHLKSISSRSLVLRAPFALAGVDFKCGAAAEMEVRCLKYISYADRNEMAAFDLLNNRKFVPTLAVSSLIALKSCLSITLVIVPIDEVSNVAS